MSNTNKQFLFVVEKGSAADATDALLIVQPCDEDEEKDDSSFFFIFPSNGAKVE